LNVGHPFGGTACKLQILRSARDDKGMVGPALGDERKWDAVRLS
jgi:hypothetical protein